MPRLLHDELRPKHVVQGEGREQAGPDMAVGTTGARSPCEVATTQGAQQHNSDREKPSTGLLDPCPPHPPRTLLTPLTAQIVRRLSCTCGSSTASPLSGQSPPRWDLRQTEHLAHSSPADSSCRPRRWTGLRPRCHTGRTQ
ncbi:hypothetical protein GN956_G8427 [Arapaima gigas]